MNLAIPIISLGIVGTSTVYKITEECCFKLAGLVSKIAIEKHPGIIEMNQCLKKLDIEFRLNIFKALLHKYENNNKGVLNNEILHALSEQIHEIDAVMDEIHNIYLNHKQMYFASWRSLDFTPQINKISDAINILENRIKLLKNVININCMNSLMIHQQTHSLIKNHQTHNTKNKSNNLLEAPKKLKIS